MAATQVNILVVEDSEEDALLAIRELTVAGLDVAYERVQTAPDFQKALSTKTWDLIISDYSMPSFTGIKALEILRDQNEDIPFIFVSGTINEDQAITAMRSGANDYVLKGNLKRLAPAVQRSLADAKIKKERTLYEKQFLQAQKMESLGQLTGGIAHDFNNLLMIIQGTLYLLRLDLTGHEEFTQQIDQALEACHTGADLIKRLMLFSRQQQLHPEILKLQDVLPNIGKLIRPLLGSAITVEINVQDNIWPVLVDERQLESAIVNLAANSRDAMNGKGKLIISTTNVSLTKELLVKHIYRIAPGDYVKISVQDSGSGIAPEHLDHVIEPFFTTKEAGKGTGLGLSMVYGFVKQSEGFISIESTQWQGTEINLYFPKRDAIKPTEIKTIPTKLTQLHGNEVILIVEDESSLRKLAAKYLESLGYQVIEAEHGAQAVELLNQHPVHLILTDVIMPGGLTGPELVTQALALKPELKFVFTSGYPKSDLFARHINIKDHPILTKPFSKLELATLLRQVLDAHGKTPEL
jgi:signal transduction histidine kinase